MMPAALGLIVRLFQPADEEGGVNANVLTLPYSVFLALWSVAFLSTWRKKENEHRFLWGSEGMVFTQRPRPEYKGVLEINEETNREEMVDQHKWHRPAKYATSWLGIVLLIVVTAFGAYVATTVKYMAPNPCLSEEQLATGEVCPFKYKFGYKGLSALCNLVVIQLAGRIFEKLAEMMNEWENHKTETQFQNMLIMKNFVFQFFNK